MNIGFDAKRLFFNQRGLGNYSRDTVRILSSLKPENQYHLFTPSTKNAITFALQDNCQIVTPEGLLQRQFPSLWRTYWSRRDIERLQLDIYHGLSHELPVGIEKTNTRSVVTMHDVIFLRFPHLYPYLDRKLYERKYLRSCRVADVVVAISEQTKRDLIEYASIDERTIRVVYQGCHPLFTHVSTHEEKVRIAAAYNLPEHFLLNVGAIEKRKNQELIIRAMAEGKIDLPLVIVGRPTPYISELKAYVDKARLDSKVIFLTSVPVSDLPTIYQLSSLFIYPSFVEGFGIPILEALNSGVPVIASTGSCMEETGGQKTCYINPQDAEELGHAINALLSDEEKRNMMVEAGKKHACLFSDEAVAENLFSIYQSLC